MNNDQINELLALMGQQIKDQAELRREQAELRETSDRRFAQLTDVMVNGFLRLEDRLGARIDNVSARVDHLTDRVDYLTEEVKEIKEDVRELKDDVRELKGDVRELKGDVRELKGDVRELKTQSQETNRRLGNVFEHTGQLTETTEATGLRLSHVEEAQQPSNAELHQRLLAVESRLNQAS